MAVSTATSVQPGSCFVVLPAAILILDVHPLSGCTSELRRGKSRVCAERGRAGRLVPCGLPPSTLLLGFLRMLSGGHFGAVPAPR